MTHIFLRILCAYSFKVHKLRLSFQAINIATRQICVHGLKYVTNNRSTAEVNVDQTTYSDEKFPLEADHTSDQVSADESAATDIARETSSSSSSNHLKMKDSDAVAQKASMRLLRRSLAKPPLREILRMTLHHLMSTFITSAT